eukprot:GHVN01013336.1.p1 GENE.GHVN01013336.1~~GHVN01013336.1.p1  ORF type:complete len:143 (-),score=14.47 GHVN01013336.1:146-574(-)
MTPKLQTIQLCLPKVLSVAPGETGTKEVDIKYGCTLNPYTDELLESYYNDAKEKGWLQPFEYSSEWTSLGSIEDSFRAAIDAKHEEREVSVPVDYNSNGLYLCQGLLILILDSNEMIHLRGSKLVGFASEEDSEKAMRSEKR